MSDQFWKGFGSVLDIFPNTGEEKVEAYYNGRDLSNSNSSDEGLREDWSHVIGYHSDSSYDHADRDDRHHHKSDR